MSMFGANNPAVNWSNLAGKGRMVEEQARLGSSSEEAPRRGSTP